MAEPTKIISCTCENKFQDNIYGANNRLCNNAPMKGSNPGRYRCTVCGKEHVKASKTLGDDKSKKNKKSK